MLRREVEAVPDIYLAPAVQVDDSGKVQRLRKVCPAPTCGPGTFMATHFNRVYWCADLASLDWSSQTTATMLTILKLIHAPALPPHVSACAIE